VAAEGNVVDVVVLFVVVGAAVTTETESSVGIAAFPEWDVSDNHETTTTKNANAEPMARCLCVATEVTLRR